MIVCTEESCAHSVKNHAWGQIKASDWFFQRDGTAYCPDHIPSWVAEWKARKAKKAGSA